MDIQTQQTELKLLIIKGKEQGFLTYSEINDHLPEGMNDTDQIETVVNMINDMGIDVFDSAPDPDSLLLKTTNDEEEVVEEAEAVLTTAVESEFGRTTDPVRMYMREMGTVDLLTRQDEIDLAKRIEDGIRQSVAAIASCPLVINEVIEIIGRYAEGKLKLPEIIVGFVDPNAEEEIILASPPESKDDNSGQESESSVPIGPDPEEAKEHIDGILNSYKSFLRARQRYAIGAPQLKKHQQKIADQVMLLRLAPKQIDNLSRIMRDTVEVTRILERAVANICIKKAKISRNLVLDKFMGRESDHFWIRSLMRGKEGSKSVLRAHSDELHVLREKFEELEKQVGIPISEIKEISRRMSIGEAKARRAKKEMVEANLRLVI